MKSSLTFRPFNNSDFKAYQGVNSLRGILPLIAEVEPTEALPGAAYIIGNDDENVPVIAILFSDTSYNFIGEFVLRSQKVGMEFPETPEEAHKAGWECLFEEGK